MSRQGNADPDVSIVVPVFNEEDVLDEFVRRTIAACSELAHTWELIMVDDGSSDTSAEIIGRAAAEHPRHVTGVFLNRNYGQHAALMAAFAQARGALVVTIDADLQNPPEEIGTLVAKADEGYDVVGSVRRDRRDTLFRRLSSSIINNTTRRVTGVDMHDYGCMLRAYGRPVVDAMLQCTERSTFIPVLANSFARRTTEVEVDHSERGGGESKYGLWQLINLQFDLLTSMTTFPLRLLSIVGGLISLAAIGFGVLLAVLRFAMGAEWAGEGVFTLFAVLFLFVGVQFVAMGLLGEYLGRVYHDVRARPRYFVSRVVGVGGETPRHDDSHANSDVPYPETPGTIESPLRQESRKASI